GPEHGEGLRQTGTHHRHIAPMVAGSLLLLVAWIVLFVHNHQAQIGERRKDCGASAQHDRGYTTPHAPPIVMALGLSHPAVEECHSIFKPLEELRLRRG